MTSVPNDQPTSHGSGSPAWTVQSIAAATSSPSLRPSSNVPSLAPAPDAVPLVLKRRTAISARAGRRHDALRNKCESIIPPCVGKGCTMTIVATGAASSGRASSPTRVKPSAVRSRTCSRRAGKTLFARISATHTLCRTEERNQNAAVAIHEFGASTVCANGADHQSRHPSLRATQPCGERQSRCPDCN